MASQMAILTRTRILLRVSQTKSISSFPFLSQEPQLAESAHTAETQTTPLPPNPASGSPLYHENWRDPNAARKTTSLAQSLIPLGFLSQTPGQRIQYLSQILDAPALMNHFADLMTQQRWTDVKELFEFWVRSLDKNGKPNKPDVNLYNHYLRANFMIGASAGDLLDLVAQMDEFAIVPNTAAFNFVLKAMKQAKETEAAEKLLERMLQGGTESLPDDETYDLVIGMLFEAQQFEAALNHIDMALKSGYKLSMRVFTECVACCVKQGRLDELATVIEMCKTTDQNRALYPNWTLCNYLAEVAMQADNSKLAFYALEFMAKWIARGENARPPFLLSVDEGLIVSALATAGRTYSSKLLDVSWAILRRSLRQKKVPNPESFLGKIYAHASLGNLQKAFGTLHEFEATHGKSTSEAEDLFSPFTSLYPLVVACSKNGFETLDSVYYQLENLSRADPPYKSVAALNCIILGCGNIWDIERAYQTFDAISSSFGLTPDIHSYNALIYAFGKLKKVCISLPCMYIHLQPVLSWDLSCELKPNSSSKYILSWQTFEASSVFEHMLSLGVKPNAKSYSLLIDAHLINRDQKAALSTVDKMVTAGFVPSKETLKRVRRRCIREMDYECDDKVESLAKKFRIRMGSENRRSILFDLDYGTEYAS
ncbi:pentatricopeptide repeat-containing protein mitochondrial-like [Gossypium australe]|uniref:Pentatricopeptide repeat-containing protein mitochondrial-like n=1 Tax=Gossypium australe TaxID=47621 RepID=A0A5B6WSC3_9ROSI|nr:pentatricopeptide repeat-containing protein mitochondrial-like [Gossypium australe]